MKCQKCGYTSFDYNQRCPKCNKDLSQEREWVNLPPFKPNPPALLDGIAGEGRASDLDLALLKAKDARSLEQEITLGLQEDEAQIDFDIAEPNLDLDLGAESDAEGMGSKDSKTVSDSEAELKLVLDI